MRQGIIQMCYFDVEYIFIRNSQIIADAVLIFFKI